MARTVYIVRHGNTFDKGDVVTRVGARTDLPLSSSGSKQVIQLGAHFSAIEPDGFTAAYTGPLIRTKQTTEAILSASQNPPELTIQPFLREVDYGPDENQPETDVVARIGEEALKAWEENAIPPKGWRVDPVAMQGNWRNFFDKIAKTTFEDARPVLIVTSNGIARFALRAADVLPEGAPLKLKTAAYGKVILHDDGKVEVLDWNVTS